MSCYRVKYTSGSKRINNDGLYGTKDEISVFPSRDATRVGTMHYIWCLVSSREQCSCAMLFDDALTEILISFFGASLFTLTWNIL